MSQVLFKCLTHPQIEADRPPRSASAMKEEAMRMRTLCSELPYRLPF